MSQLNVDTLASQTGSLVSMASGHFNNFGIMQVASFGPLSGSSNQLETTSNTYADVPNLTITITPKVATSKIFYMATVGYWMTEVTGRIKVVENSTGSFVDLHEMRMQGNESGTHSGGGNTQLMGLLDHNTTNAITLKIQGAKEDYTHSNNRFRINWYDQEAFGIACEIGNI